jgi:hypothetical protein
MKIIAERFIVHGNGEEAAPGTIIEIDGDTAASLIANGFASACAEQAPEPVVEAPAKKAGKLAPVVKSEAEGDL